MPYIALNIMHDSDRTNRRNRLLDFLRLELEEEERWGFPRLHRIPDSHLQDRLKHYKLLDTSERKAFRDCSAHCAYRATAFLVDAPEIELTAHPYYRNWSTVETILIDDPGLRNVPMLRAIVQQYNLDKHRNVPSAVSEEQFVHACSVQPVKLAERRRRIRAELKRFGLFKTDNLGNCYCSRNGQEFAVYVDFGGKYAQLRYGVWFPEFKEKYPYHALTFETAVGFQGGAHWNYIVEENKDDVFELFSEIVAHLIELPARIRKAVF